MELTVIGSHECTFCKKAKEELNERGIEYKFVDILESLSNLKILIKIRDTSDIYEDIRSGDGSRIGLPCFSIGEFYIRNIEEAINYLNK